MDATKSFDPAKAEAFANQMVGLLNNASLSLMISIGHRTGLFDKLSNLPPSTSEQIANATNLNERYVREWLGAMVTGRSMDYNPTDQTYKLAPEHAAFLTRGAGADNLAMFTQYIGLMGGVEDKILECFRNGGGVPYSEYPRFQEVMSNARYTASCVRANHCTPPTSVLHGCCGACACSPWGGRWCPRCRASRTDRPAAAVTAPGRRSARQHVGPQCDAVVGDGLRGALGMAAAGQIRASAQRSRGRPGFSRATLATRSYAWSSSPRRRRNWCSWRAYTGAAIVGSVDRPIITAGFARRLRLVEPAFVQGEHRAIGARKPLLGGLSELLA